MKAVAGKDVNVSEWCLCRWRMHLDPFCPTGNKVREQVLGVDLINLMIFHKALPKAHLDGMAVFIYNKGGQLYPIRVISKSLDELKIMKKRASTEAYQAQSEDIQFCVRSFWNCPSPLGIFGVP